MVFNELPQDFKMSYMMNMHANSLDFPFVLSSDMFFVYNVHLKVEIKVIHVYSAENQPGIQRDRDLSGREESKFIPANVEARKALPATRRSTGKLPYVALSAGTSMLAMYQLSSQENREVHRFEDK